MRCSSLIHAQRIRAELIHDALLVKAEEAHNEHRSTFQTQWGVFDTEHVLECAKRMELKENEDARVSQQCG